jgi:hypothetical protein
MELEVGKILHMTNKDIINAYQIILDSNFAIGVLENGFLLVAANLNKIVTEIYIDVAILADL